MAVAKVNELIGSSPDSFELCCQGGSFGGPGGIQLCNALDLGVGL